MVENKVTLTQNRGSYRIPIVWFRLNSVIFYDGTSKSRHLFSDTNSFWFEDVVSRGFDVFEFHIRIKESFIVTHMLVVRQDDMDNSSVSPKKVVGDIESHNGSRRINIVRTVVVSNSKSSVLNISSPTSR